MPGKIRWFLPVIKFFATASSNARDYYFWDSHMGTIIDFFFTCYSFLLIADQIFYFSMLVFLRIIIYILNFGIHYNIVLLIGFSIQLGFVEVRQLLFTKIQFVFDTFFRRYSLFQETSRNSLSCF